MTDNDENYCRDHPLDPRCVKRYETDANERLVTVLDKDSPYYNERSAKCLLRAKGLGLVTESEVTGANPNKND